MPLMLQAQLQELLQKLHKDVMHLQVTTISHTGHISIIFQSAKYAKFSLKQHS